MTIQPLPTISRTQSDLTMRFESVDRQPEHSLAAPDWSWLARIAQQMTQAETIGALLENTVTQVRQHFCVDRVVLGIWQSSEQIQIVAESCNLTYAPMVQQILPAIVFGSELTDTPTQHQPTIRPQLIETIPPELQSLWQSFQVQTSLTVPIHLQEPWGLLALHQCATPGETPSEPLGKVSAQAPWSAAAITLLYLVVAELRLHLSQWQFRSEQQALSQWYPAEMHPVVPVAPSLPPQLPSSEPLELLGRSITAVQESAHQIAHGVQQITETLQTGIATREQVVALMESLQQTLSTTNRGLKHLNESCQKISKGFRWIGQLTSQSQLLALNASIAATRAGEYGRDFAAVTDELRSLTQQSMRAVTDLEQLVQAIQLKTAEVSTTLEMGVGQTMGTDKLIADTSHELQGALATISQIDQLAAGIAQTTPEQLQHLQSLPQISPNLAQP